ncbi:MAG: hypothetical protein PVG78_08220 [Desulfobacterales bacterium]|jgi:hypothetical protein
MGKIFREGKNPVHPAHLCFQANGSPLSLGGETIRAVENPVMVADFDGNGFDYIGPLMIPGFIGNSGFRFRPPQNFFASFMKYRNRKTHIA